jgi:phage tail-like protein
MPEIAPSKLARYPLAAYNFRVTVGSTVMGFSEVSGLAQEYQTLSYRDGLSFKEGERVARFMATSSEITLKKGVFDAADTKKLHEWMRLGDKRELTVDLCDERANTVVSWIIKKAMVIKLEAPAFDANSNEVAIETLTLWVSGISIGKTRS